MFINIDQDEHIPEIKTYICDWHKKHPGQPFGRCACGVSYGQRKASPEEYLANCRARLLKEQKELQDKLILVNRQLSQLIEI